MSRRLHILLLGQCLVFIDDQFGTLIDRVRQQALLAYLLLHRHAPQSRQHLAFTFWPDSTEQQAHTNLRKLYFQLRQALPNADTFLAADKYSLGWRGDAPYRLDVAELEQALSCLEQPAPLNVAVVEQVLALYRGELLPNCYDDWILPIRRSLHERVVNTLTQALAKLETQHEVQVGLQVASHLLRLDALHEAAYRHLMQLRALAGDRIGALRIYHECVTLLDQELGVSPTTETIALYQQLLHGEPGNSPLPVTPTRQRHEHIPLVGRKREWKLLYESCQLIGKYPPYLFTLWGEAGIGKTRLVEELWRWARLRSGTVSYARAFAAEGALSYGPIIEWLRSEPLYKWLETLEPLWQTEVARLLPELLIKYPALPAPLPMHETWQRQRFYEALARAVLAAPSPRLLLLEDMHWADTETVAWLRYLLRFDPQAALLIVGTVRSEAVDEEHGLHDLLRHLQREGRHEQLELAPLSQDETVLLAGYVVDEDVTRWSTQLYQETEGNPLFVVELVRSGFRSADAAKDQPRFLPPTLQTVIETRLAKLSSPARTLAHLAATVGRSFSAAILAAASDLEEDVLVQGLDELWRRRLVREHSEGYDFSHDKIREVAYSQLSRERRRLLHRKIAKAIEIVSRNSVDSASGQVAAHWEAAGESEQAAHFYERAALYAAARLANHDAIRYFSQALRHLPAAFADTRRYKILLARYKLLNIQGRREEERADLTTLQELVKHLPDTHEATRQRAEVALCAARYWFGVEDRLETKHAARTAVELAEQCQAVDLAAQAYWHWGATEFWNKANYAAARPLLEKALQFARTLGMQRTESESLVYLAMLQLFTGGSIQLIEKWLRQSLAIYQNCGDKAGEAFVLGMLAYMIILQGEGRYEEAIGYCQDALNLGTEAIGWDATRFALGNMGYCYYLVGDAAQALANMEQELSLAQQSESPGSTAGSLWGLGALYFDLGDYAKAQELLLEALRLLQMSDSYPYQVKVLGLLALVLHALEEPVQARAYGEQAVNLAKRVGDPRLEATVCRRLARVLITQAEGELAEDLLQRALLLHHQMEQQGQALRALAGLAEVAMRRNQPQQAQEYAKEILKQLTPAPFDATDEVLYIYMTCYSVLKLAGDPRADEILSLAYAQLQSRAATLTSDSLQQRFWTAPAHRAVRNLVH